MKRDYYVTPKAGPVMRMLWKAAGGDRYILERATYSDQVKYACLGGIILATGGLAAIAGGYAFYTIFEPKGYALNNIVLEEININWSDTLSMNKDHINAFKQNAETFAQGQKDSYVDKSTAFMSTIFGLIWGLIIFNIDRFIVTSTGKGDGTEAITWDEFKSAIPRIIMGTIIAITISKPIEIRMFKSEIDVALSHVQDSISNASLNTKNLTVEKKIKSHKEKIEKLNQEVLLKYNAYKQNQDRYLRECEGLGSHGRGCGPIAENIRKQMQVDSIEYSKIEIQNNPIINKLRYDINDAEQELEENKKQAIRIVGGLDGLLERIKICHEVAGGWITFFITLLFLAIELTPIFFKLMLTKTPYDYLAENRDDLIKAESGIEVRYDYYKDKDGLERHLVINHSAEKMIYEKQLLATAEKVLNRYAIQKYIEIEKKKIDENPENYIKHNNETDEEKLI